MLAFLNLGGSEVLLLLLLLLLLFGVDKAPQMARTLGKARGELDRAQKQLTSAMRSEEEKALAEQLAFERVRDQHVAGQPTDEQHASLLRAAHELGVETAGRTDEEIRVAMTKRLAGASGSEE